MILGHGNSNSRLTHGTVTINKYLFLVQKTRGSIHAIDSRLSKSRLARCYRFPQDAGLPYTRFARASSPLVSSGFLERYLLSFSAEHVRILTGQRQDMSRKRACSNAKSGNMAQDAQVSYFQSLISGSVADPELMNPILISPSCPETYPILSSC